LQICAADYIVSKTLEKFRDIHAVVNIAGAVPQLDPFTMTDSQWDDGFGLKPKADSKGLGISEKIRKAPSSSCLETQQ